MARTLNGNLRGRAARITIDDLVDPPRTFGKEYREALAKLKELDSNWERWYDNRPEKTCGEMLPLIKKRIEKISVRTMEQASCEICIIADALKACDVCAFRAYLKKMPEFTRIEVLPDPLETVGDWAADWPWADEDEDLRGLYAYGI